MTDSAANSFLIGVTGGIASGKSTVAGYLCQAGYSVIEADKLGHRVLEAGHPGYQKIVQKFGQEILHPDGTVKRSVLGKIVFADPEKLKQLNQISHPLIAEMIREEMLKLAPESKGRIVFLEAALLIEAGWYKVCQQVWVVMLESAMAIQRLQKRNGLTEAEAQTRLNSQLAPEERLPFADVVLHNNGSPKELLLQTQKALSNCIYEKSSAPDS